MSSLSPRRLVATAAAALSLVLVVGCGSTSDTAAGNSETRTVKTEQGDVEVPTEVDSVVVLNYALAGFLYDLDVPVTATTPEHTEGKAEPSKFWKEEAEEAGTEFLPWNTDGFDLEAILEADPDLIIAGGIGFPLKHATDAYEDLSDIAPTVVVSGKLETWQEQYSFIAKDVFDKKDVYDKAVADYQARSEEVKENITLPPGPVSFLMTTGDKTPYILIEDMGLPKVMSTIGFETAPLFEENDVEPYTAGGDSFEVSTENVGQILDSPTVFVMGFNMETFSAEDLKKEPVYSQLPAFEEDNVYDLPYWVMRGDYDEAMELLNIIEKEFS
ncbi:MAG TPA: ABC transporter substrate-binding protein [Candidatus Stackebrandtia faecavium]|nr:ABC transporter substrate-binding protein [Candidatus Stackebrandtia faecavium]